MLAGILMQTINLGKADYVNLAVYIEVIDVQAELVEAFFFEIDAKAVGIFLNIWGTDSYLRRLILLFLFY